MSIGLQHVINSRFAVQFLSVIARGIPPRLGYPLSEWIGGWIATRSNSKITQAVRVNQSIARGIDLESSSLDKAVRETLQNNARDIYNLYHYLQRLQAMQQMIHLSPQAQEVIERPEFAERGLVVVGLHLSNFDFVLRSISQHGFKALILTIPDPKGGRRVEYEMRKETGMNLAPVSISALRQAANYLKQGGLVVTGMDRPVPDSKYRPRFFGEPACVPTHHVYLGLKALVPVIVMAVIQESDGKYHVLSSEPIEMECYSDRKKEIVQNAEKVLKQAENFIRLAPQQWNVPMPVWPKC